MKVNKPLATLSSTVAPITITQLHQQCSRQLQKIGQVWVMGEVSNLACPQSGHIYLSLKDKQSQVRCAWFRQSQSALRRQLSDGIQVIVQATVSLYAPRGDFQLIINQLLPAGEGLLQQRFQQLQQKLESEGLFAAERKQALPAMPHQVAVITSATGAALQDILTVLKRRCPLLPVRIYPSTVQGRQAHLALIAALSKVVNENCCDVIIIARGGGSLEDLWPFNEEPLVRALVKCPIPIISGIGHETDITLTDLVADYRAATPSAAAETASPDQQHYQSLLTELTHRFTAHIKQKIQFNNQRLQQLQLRLKHPLIRLQRDQQTLDHLDKRFQQALKHYSSQLQTEKKRLRDCHIKLIKSMQQIQGNAQQRLQALAHHHQLLNPMQTLQRGYAIVESTEQPPTMITHANQLRPAQTIKIKLNGGWAKAQVTQTEILDK